MSCARSLGRAFSMFIASITIAVACSDNGEPASPSAGSAEGGADCAPGTKRCGDSCVAVTQPEVGCGAPSCDKCIIPHAASMCAADGRCAPATCENGWGDCNAEDHDGCEVDLTTSRAHCGSCGLACAAKEVCVSGTCVDENAAGARAWLATQANGWCLASYNQMINLCGDVEFCFDSRIMRAYPTGLALDVGFDVEDVVTHGNIAKLGGDCDGQAIGIGVDGGRLETFGFQANQLGVAIAPGRHLVSYQITSLGSALFVDGLRVAIGGPPPVEMRLLDKCGPGLVLGQRFSYWWESAQRLSWGRHAPFFVQLREGIGDFAAYTVTRATTAGAGTVFLFDEGGVGASTWRSRAGVPLVGVVKNALAGDPEIDAGASGPLPEWRPLASCALR